MRTIVVLTILAISSQDFSTSTMAAACNTKSALLCQNLLKDCLKNCDANNNPASCRQACLGQFKGCKASAGCGGA